MNKKHTFDLHLDRHNGIAIAVIDCQDVVVSPINAYLIEIDHLSYDDVAQLINNSFPQFISSLVEYDFTLYETVRTSRDGIVMTSPQKGRVEFNQPA